MRFRNERLTEGPCWINRVAGAVTRPFRRETTGWAVIRYFARLTQNKAKEV